MNIFKHKDVITYFLNTDNESGTKDSFYNDIRQSYKLFYDTKIENNEKNSCLGIWEAVAAFNRTEYAAPPYKYKKTIKSVIEDASDNKVQVIIYDHCMFQLFNDMLSSKIEYKPFNDDIIDVLISVFEKAKIVGYIDYDKTIESKSLTKRIKYKTVNEVLESYSKNPRPTFFEQIMKLHASKEKEKKIIINEDLRNFLSYIGIDGIEKKDPEDISVEMTAADLKNKIDGFVHSTFLDNDVKINNTAKVAAAYKKYNDFANESKTLNLGKEVDPKWKKDKYIFLMYEIYKNMLEKHPKRATEETVESLFDAETLERMKQFGFHIDDCVTHEMKSQYMPIPYYEQIMLRGVWEFNNDDKYMISPYFLNYLKKGENDETSITWLKKINDKIKQQQEPQEQQEQEQEDQKQAIYKEEIFLPINKNGTNNDQSSIVQDNTTSDYFYGTKYELKEFKVNNIMESEFHRICMIFDGESMQVSLGGKSKKSSKKYTAKKKK
jgi:hypothetical protein